MHRKQTTILLTAALILSMTGLGDAAITSKPAQVERGHLTAPSSESPRDIATAYLIQASAELGLAPADLADIVVRDEYRSAHNGVTHIYLSQRLNGIEVVNADSNINIDRQGRVILAGSRFVSDLSSKANIGSPAIGPVEALTAAARHLELQPTDFQLQESLGGPASQAIYSGGGISLDQIPVKLMYLPTDGGQVRLVWEAVVRLQDGQHWFDLFIDAATGEVLEKFNWIANELEGGPEYDVIPLPAESPLDSPQTTVFSPSDPTASPFGWHDTDGTAGAEFTDTRGNNVFAQTDLDANNNPVGEVQPNGGLGLIFNFPWNELLDPEDGTNKEASVVNLYYWNNILHDVLYQYGFDEPAGNFQENNYGNGGAGGDPVQADALDGSGTNNANFATPPDGFDPRMQMFRWLYPFPYSLDLSGTLNDSYVMSGAVFGPPATGQSGAISLADDGTGPDVNDGCEAFTIPAGNIALIRRGNCNFTVKVANAQTTGAVAAIIQKITPGNPITLGGTDPTIVIPSGMISQDNGNTIIANLPGVTGSVDADASPPPDRDSDFDNGIIAHEYGHGVSNRLTGGPATTGCLNHNEQAGEGWSDWWTLTLYPMPSDTRTTTRGVGNYASFEPFDAAGIRNFPYSTDMAVNPQTYEDIGTTNIPHGVGEIWAAMLWEMYWNLVDRYGFDADLYQGTGGNNLAIQLVIDGMKMQPCSPTFVQARDATLAADQANNSGANSCEIWNAFAKRGLGFSAIAGSTGVGDEVEAFDLPPGVPSVCTGLFSDGFESGDVSAWSLSQP